MVAAALALGPAFAQDDAPLGAAELAHCAGLVQTLRSQSQRLNRQAAEFDTRRQALAEQRATLQAPSPRSKNPANGDTGGSTVAAEAWIRYNAAAAAFNEEIAAFRGEVAAINEVKREYERLCANRAYRQSDLEALAAPAREAMVEGLADVRVPYSD